MASSGGQSRLYILCGKSNVKAVKTWLEGLDALWKGEKIEEYCTEADGGDAVRTASACK